MPLENTDHSLSPREDPAEVAPGRGDPAPAGPVLWHLETTGGESQLPLVSLTHIATPFNNGVHVVFPLCPEAGMLVFNQRKVIERPHVGRPGKMSHSFTGGFKKMLLSVRLPPY